MNDAQNWATDEFAGADFGDQRLTKRVATIAAAIAGNPTASIPTTFERWSDTKACYNFLASEKVTPARIRMPHQQRTVDRIGEHSTVLVIQDITDLDFTGRRSVKGLGYLDAPFMQGVLVQTALAVTPDGAPLGVLEQHTWIRDPETKQKRSRSEKAKHVRSRPIEQKQTQHWLDVQASIYRQCAELGSTIVTVSDREADFHEYFALPRPEQMHVLVRVTHDRKLADEPKRLRQALSEQPVLGELVVEIGRSGERPPRTARLAIRAMRTTLAAPAWRNGTEAPERVEVSLVGAVEIDAPSDQKPIDWTLLTTLSLGDDGSIGFEDAVRIVDYYSRRWLIERFHYTLKSGCAIEQLQLEDRERIDNALAVYSVVAWRLMDLLYQSRIAPDADAGEYFDDDELLVLRLWATKQQPTKSRVTNRRIARPPVQSLTLEQAVRTIARKGGFLARTGDGDPGVKTLWRGLTKLAVAVEMLRGLRASGRLSGNA